MVVKVTIQDIARLAGVSKTTVSRVLNRKPDVDPLTRERILDLMREHGFVPSIVASTLAGRSRLIGVLVPALTWPLMPEIMRGVAEAVGQTPYELLLYSVSNSNHEKNRGDVIERILAKKLVAGLLAIYPGQSSSYLSTLHDQGFPVVMLDDQAPPSSIPWIGSDNLDGAYRAVNHLMRLGHQRIACIQGPMKYLCSRERYLGYCKALQEGGLALQSELVYEGDFQVQGGYQAACSFFSLPPEHRPTAIFASSDLMAYGVLTAAEEHSLDIPGDLALIGFDDLLSSAHMRPPMTTIRQPFYEMGRQGIQLLLSLLNTPQTPSVAGRQLVHSGRTGTNSAVDVMENSGREQDRRSVRIQLATFLVMRASCGSSLYSPDSNVMASL